MIDKEQYISEKAGLIMVRLYPIEAIHNIPKVSYNIAQIMYEHHFKLFQDPIDIDLTSDTEFNLEARYMANGALYTNLGLNNINISYNSSTPSWKVSSIDNDYPVLEYLSEEELKKDWKILKII